MTKKHWDEINKGIKKFLKTKNLVDRFNFENATDEMTCTDGILSAWIHSDVEQAYEQRLSNEVTWIDFQAFWDVNDGDCLWIRCCCHCMDFDDEEHEQMLDGEDAQKLKTKFQDQIQEEYDLSIVGFILMEHDKNFKYEATETLPQEFYDDIIRLLNTGDGASEEEMPIDIAYVTFSNGADMEIKVCDGHGKTPYVHAQLWETNADDIQERYDVDEPENDPILGDWEAEGHESYIVHVVLEA